MEFYGSIASVSGSITASLFTGSFKGDGGSLYNLPASGVTGLNLSQIASGNATASISSTGFTVNKNTQIQGDLSVTGSIIATNYIVSSSVTYMTTSFASGSSMFGNDNNDVHQFTGSVAIAGTLSLNGIAVGVGKLDETTFQSYTSSISSSISSSLGLLSSSIALTDVSQSNRLTTIESNYATTGSNLFKGSQTISGSIIPSVDNTYDLGSTTHQWRDVYISSGSLYIDGTKVLGSTSQELTITTDTGQSIKILEAGSDSIILQSADGDIELKSSGGGDILFDPTNGLISIKGTTQIQDGFKITSSGGTNIVFGDTVIVSGSIDLTGNVDGIDLQSFSSSVSTSIGSLLGGNTSLSSSIATTTSGLSSSIGSLSSSIATTTSGLTSTITSVSSSLTSSIGSLSSSLATTTSGLSSSIGSLSSSVATTTSGLSSSIATTTSGLSSSIGSLSSSVATTTSGLSSSVGNLSSSIATTTSGLTSTITSLSSSLTSSIGSISSSINSTISSLSSSVSTSIGGLSSSIATTTSGLSSSIGFLSSSIATTTIGAKNRIDSIETTTSSLNTFSSSINTTIKNKLDSESIISGSVQVIITGTTGYLTFSSSVSTSIVELSSSVATTTSGLTSTITSLSSSLTSSIGGLSSSIATTTSGLSSSIGSLSSSIATTTSGLSSSIATTTLGIKNRVDSIESKTGSYATTGSNIFQGTQTITGSLYISQNLIVQGSSSLENITASAVSIGTNKIILNSDTPAIRYAGISVFDSGSTNVTASLFYDSLTNNWKFQHSDVGTDDASILLYGPLGTGIDNTQTLVGNFLTKVEDNGHGHHLTTSSIFDNGSKISLNNNTEITGSLIVAGGNKLTVNAAGGDEGGEILLGKAITNTTLAGDGVTIDVWQNRLRFFEQGGNARGAFLDISTLANGVGTNLLGTAATASYVEYSNVANKPTLVSGSSQIAHDSTTGYVANRHIDHTAVSISAGNGLSGGGDISTTRTLTLDTGSVHFLDGVKKELNTEGVISGSSQISYTGLSNIPSGIVSSSAQTIANLPSGTVSGSAQVLNGTTIHSGSFFNGISVVSGSAQIDLTATTNYASGILTRLNAVGVFSGSAQVTGIGNAQLTNSSFHVGTTSISLGRASASQTLTGVSIDGTAAYATQWGTGAGYANFSSTAISSGVGWLFGTTGNGTYAPVSLASVSSLLNLSGTNTGDETLARINALAITTVGTITSGTWNGTAIANANLANSSFHVGTTSISLGRASASQTLTGVSIDGNAATATTAPNGSNSNSFYNVTAGNGNGIKFWDSDAYKISMGNSSLYQYGTVTDYSIKTQMNDADPGRGFTWGRLSTAPIASLNATSGNMQIAGTFASSNYSGASSGTNTGDETLARINALAITTVGTITSGTWNGTAIANANLANSSFHVGTTSISLGRASSSQTLTGVSIDGNAATATSATTAGSTGTLSSNAVTSGYLVIGGNYSNNAHSSVDSTRLFFGGGDTDAITNYYIGTNKENFGGNHAKLDLRWHTGIRMGAQSSYGGIRFYDSEDLGTVLFSIGTSDSNVRSHTNLLPSSNNSYNLGSASLGWANVYTNDLHLSNMNKPEGNDIDGTKGTWTIQEGVENLYIINNNNGEKFKIVLEKI
jgi:hypothetical protein